MEVAVVRQVVVVQAQTREPRPEQRRLHACRTPTVSSLYCYNIIQYTHTNQQSAHYTAIITIQYTHTNQQSAHYTAIITIQYTHTNQQSAHYTAIIIIQYTHTNQQSSLYTAIILYSTPTLTNSHLFILL